jgi:hypothetical protein
MLLLVSTSSPHLREAAPGREKLIFEHEETREMELVQSAKWAGGGLLGIYFLRVATDRDSRLDSLTKGRISRHIRPRLP